MSVPRSGPAWRRIFVVLLAAVIGFWFWFSRGEFPHGGSTIGLIYGTSGFLLILLLSFFGIRKRWYRSRLGTLEQWLQAHIYLGLLVLVVLLLHTGGRFNDRIAVITLILLGVVVISGIAGSILYVTVPRLLTEVESDLTVEEISEQLNQLGRTMARLASGRSAAFQKIYGELIRLTLPASFAGWGLLVSRLKRRRPKEPADWTRLLTLAPAEEQEELRQLLVISRQRKELLLRLTYQQRYRNVLEFWLYIHVPFTVALLLFSIVHIAAVFYYGRMPW
ncbi:MAG TPA: hypothetical protein VMT00_02390 [Thermoanaerobaculia bacterium]|nr:hypothetical protein [Thermoanaerobaculia bacterium]